ncbi:M55 family metallopeptidase [Robbsia sp. Bb-Pol-6]|uniref:M55 family metallopeptidase n=1 Tax=Robbsia betulipollinis TaxID=2981849 RepID=A0ABT3ZIS4_9BURK|nr:M55 family metallopeptidase [Robbsia betulipollinis]MCY0385850.1 M55 family metallopeptidase [Robbsia betulipollinis]
MNLLISADIEGVAGVFHPEQTRQGNPEYERARRWMTAEANAAIEGAFDGGATQVVVNDSHGGFRNLLPDLLDARAQIILGKPRYLGMMAGIDAPCDGVFMLGYHGRAQSRGVLAHTINSFAFARVWLDHDEVGEAGLYGALAEEYGAQVVLLTGDDVLEAETRERFALARHVRTKVAAGCHSGTSLTPDAACRAIREAAGLATAALAARRGEARTAASTPGAGRTARRCRLQVQTPALADLFCQWPTLVREDGVTLHFDAACVEDAVRMLNCLSAMSAMLR